MFNDTLFDALVHEIRTLWQAHQRVGLTGKMCLYTQPEQDPWRALNPTLKLWIGEDESEIIKGVRELKAQYNNGDLPNSPLLLNPVVHQISETGYYEPVGSGVYWATALALGVTQLSDESVTRLQDLGIQVGFFQRGENKRAGLKLLGFSDTLLPPVGPLGLPQGNREIYDLVDLASEAYFSAYPLSGIEYLTKNGSFIHPEFSAMLPATAPPVTVPVATVVDAATCWDAYDKHRGRHWHGYGQRGRR